MKNIIIAALAVCTLSACDDFLDEKLKGDFNSDNIFSNATQAELAVNGVYNAATYCIDLWKFGDVASDDAVKGGSDGDQADLSYIDDFSANADNGVLSEFWQSSYEVISRANNVIAYVPNIDMDATLRDRYVAEAKFFRAFVYFHLVNIYGEVPLKLLPQIDDASIHVGLSSVSAIYSQIEKDLRDASILPVSYSTSDAGRVTRGAAYGLLAKAQLYQQKYSDVLTTIQLIENLDIYDLERPYSNLFKLGGEDSKEVLFAVRFLSGQNPGLGNSLNQWLAPQNESGYYFDAPTQSYVDAFDEKQENGEDDLRLDASIGRDGKDWFNGDVFSSSWSPATGYLVKKHNQPLDEVGKGTKGDGGLSYIYLRYADILLMKAEALNETHHPDLAKIEVDKVRDRAGLAGVSTVTESAMREVIRKERRKELGFEFHRFFDLMRWGKDVAEAALGSSFKWQEPRFYFPIPQSEKDANLGIK